MAKETANNGFIKIHRSIMDWQHWGEPNIVVVFLTLLLNANHKRQWWQGLRCERGETFITIDTLSYITKLSRPTIIRILKVLEDSGEIVRKRVDQKHTKTVIKKYNDYQDNNLFSGKMSLLQTLPQTLPQTLLKQERKERKEEYINNNKEIAHEEILNWLVNSQYLEQFAMTESISTELCKKLATDAVTEWKMIGTTHRSVSDARKHLLDHIRKQVTIMRERGTLKAADDMDKRLKPLIDDCNALIDEGNNRDDVREFYAYWTQKCNDNTGRLLFEAQKAWNTRTRFINFLKRKK